MASKHSTSYDSPGTHGVEIDVVCGNVPVVSMEKGSVFDENASWMIQSALSSSEKAGALYEYCEDEDIQDACRRLGMSKDEVMAVRLKRMKSVRAVGVSGKRSVMLACVIAMSLHDPDGLEELWEALRSYKLHRHYWEVLELIKDSSRPTASSNADSKWTGKRKWEDDDWKSKPKSADGGGDWSEWWNSKSSRSGGKKCHSTAEALDEQLASYFDD
mmetsp:Transcript_78603/g.230643  ORF Transcript_78603/g.230643 Transcript_78603/m.230643 type:complete len:216 (+) Transcript_78603:40-687(+)